MSGSSEVALPQPGDVIGGKYTILKIIGEGGMGVVFEATHLKLGQRVAIKMLQPEVARNEDIVTRFDREARAAGRLRGRHVARVTDVDVSTDKLPYMVMEFLEGHDLATELELRGPLPVAEAVDYLLQACRGLTEAHEAGIVHRDLKPSNLFLCTEGEQRVVKLLDFGISKMVDEASKLTSTQLTMGTLFYMSPEQVRSAKHVDTRADIWALGVILYELLAGVPPFLGSAPSVAAAIVTDEAPSLLGQRPDVPEAIDATIRTALAKKPSDRFVDVLAFAAAIAPFGSGHVSVRSFVEVRTSSPSLPRLPAALESAATMLGGGPPLETGPPRFGGGPPLETGAPRVAIGGTSPGWVTGTTSRGRRRAPWIALGGAAVVALLAGAGLLALRAGRARDAASRLQAEPSVTATATAEPVPTTALAAASATAMASAPPLVTTSATNAASATSAPKATAKTPARTAAPPSGGVAPPPPPTPPPARKKEKPPLVAPF